MEACPDGFGTTAMRTFNSFLLPRSAGALSAAESVAEIARFDIDPAKVEACPDGFGAAVMRTYNSFLVPMLAVALVAAESHAACGSTPSCLGSAVTRPRWGRGGGPPGRVWRRGDADLQQLPAAQVSGRPGGCGVRRHARLHVELAKFGINLSKVGSRWRPAWTGLVPW